MYTALVLDAESHAKLVAQFVAPSDWQVIAHHMTINLGNAEAGPAAQFIGQEFVVTATTVGKDERVFAVGVASIVPSNNKIKHITVAVNVNGGGKAKHSNELTNWTPLAQPLVLRGVVQVVQ
jgi:hypothetical protein